MYDVAVIGLGVMGASAACALARRGSKVLALDRWTPGHGRGSSHGESRAIRLSYFEHPSYVPLVREAYDGWLDLERRSGANLLTVTGILEAGRPGSAIVAGSLAASRQHAIPHEHITAREVNDRFPAFRLPDAWSAVWQPDGGFLLAEESVRAFCRLAREEGAELRTGVRVTRVEAPGDRVRLVTDAGVLEAGTAIVAAGPWIADLVGGLAPALTLTRQVLGWFAPREPALFTPETFPVFILDAPEDVVYGFPDFAGTGMKCASHHASGVLSHPDLRRADPGPADEARLRSVLDSYVPEASGALLRMQDCIYTRTPDEDFILGRHPEQPRLILASPCSGHGFKFAPVLGEILADLATGRPPRHDISRFAPERAALAVGPPQERGSDAK
jgi:sarcosine oxidase